MPFTFWQKKYSNLILWQKKHGKGVLPKVSNSLSEEKLSCPLIEMWRRNRRMYSCLRERALHLQMSWMWAICSKIKHFKPQKALHQSSSILQLVEINVWYCFFHFFDWKSRTKNTNSRNFFSQKHERLIDSSRWAFFLWEITSIDSANRFLLSC